MSVLTDMVRKEAVYAGPSKAERSIWVLAIEAACKVIEQYEQLEVQPKWIESKMEEEE